jgi:hypothetical protein
MYQSHTIIPGGGDQLPRCHMNGAIPVLDLGNHDAAFTLQFAPADPDAAVRWLDALADAAYDLACQVRRRQRGDERLLAAVEGHDAGAVQS